MVSRIAKLSDYFTNVIVQNLAPKFLLMDYSILCGYHTEDFEDQRSGETLSVLTKVRTDTERFIVSFINVLFGILVGIVFVSVYAFRLHWSIMPIYVGGMIILGLLTSILSKK